MATALVNGINYSWVNITAIVLGQPLFGATKISIKEAQDIVDNYAAGPYPSSRGYGRITYEASIQMFYDNWINIVDASPNKKPTMIPPFDITIVFGGDNVLPRTMVLRSVSFMENKFETTEGDTKILVDIPLRVALLEQ